MHISDGKQHESKIAKTISFSKGCVVVVDRGYVDYAWMNVLDSNQRFFVTRSKSNMKYTVVKTFQSEALKNSVGQSLYCHLYILSRFKQTLNSNITKI
ncbi:transposase [Sphingobacterium alimentarium]|uniref:transposase n=1 Tax=Sphingobacterium alimentarium TaxID=797292 RepID=UPI001044FE0D